MFTAAIPGPGFLDGLKQWLVVAARVLTRMLVRGTVASDGKFYAAERRLRRSRLIGPG